MQGHWQTGWKGVFVGCIRQGNHNAGGGDVKGCHSPHHPSSCVSGQSDILVGISSLMVRMSTVGARRRHSPLTQPVAVAAFSCQLSGPSQNRHVAHTSVRSLITQVPRRHTFPPLVRSLRGFVSSTHRDARIRPHRPTDRSLSIDCCPVLVRTTRSTDLHTCTSSLTFLSRGEQKSRGRPAHPRFHTSA
jgi:hypothetical protein